MKRHLSKTQRTILTISIVLLFIFLLLYYGFLIYQVFAKDFFVKQAIQISETNQNPVFKIDKVLLYSSASAIDNTEEKSLKDIDISQFTDIAIYIDNTSYINELTQENTVKALRIDDIEIISNAITGMKSLTYKSPLDFGKFSISEAADMYSQKDEYIQCAPIDYTINYQNKETPDYSTPNFYTDCSNAITLSFLNKNLVPNYSVPDNKNISFNGTLLDQTKVDLNTLTTDVNFKITITNNLNENFVYNIKLNLSFDKDSGLVTNGYTFQGRESSEGNTYNFFKES